MSFLLFLLLLPACADYKLHYAREAADWQQDRPPQDLQLEHRMYLVGDAGNAPLGGTTPVLKYLKKVLAEEGPNSSILFLGDNIYPDGLPPKEDVKNRTLAEYRLRIQLEALENFQGRPIFLPGNHDWRNGLKGLRSQEKMVEKFLNKGIEDDDDWENYFLPDGGCPGPEVVELNDKLVVIVIDTQWWLADWDKEPRIHEGCEIKNKFMFRFMFENAVRKHRSKNVVIAMHHPVHSFGPHGGRFTWKEHLFPFTEIKDNLYIPFPIVGTVYAFLRGSIATKQDINHQEYKELTESLLAGVKKNGSFIFAAGHEHNLQYIERDFQKYIISGAGSKTSPAGLGKGGFFSYGRKGYATLEFYEDGQAWVQFWVPNAEGTDARLVFQKKVKDKLSTIEENIPTEFPEYEQLSDTVTRPLVRYELEPKGPVHNFLFGEHYRDLYLRQYRLPVLDLGTWRGGMTPIQRGGGNQTNSLRLADAQGHQFVMRDLTKDVTRLLPFPFNKMSLAQFIAVDNFLSTHPYAPLALPPMAEAIRIYHTNPEFFYIPKQPALGIHNDIYGGSVYLVEERPGGSWKGTDVFGGAHKFVSTPELSEKLTTKYSHRVDQPWALRSRLFDFVIGDWDRHDDQWRWARFDQPDGIKLYRPVPRDRDQAFSKYDGLFTRIATITAPFLRQLRVYSPKIGNIKWAAWSPRHFDNSFLNQLDWNEWENQVHFIQENLTDAVVDSAFLSWPDYPRQTSAPYIRQVLKQRRDQLLNTARRYYEFLSREVDVYGTEDRERFRIERLDDRRTRVRMYELSKKGKEKDLLYDRTFTHGPTREIHIYGLDGDDEFIVTGRVSKGVKLRLVGGLGEDLFHDESRVGGLGKKTLIYDNKLKNILETGPESRDKRSNRA
ncbi:MAG: metallophosphoesterase, partial [Bacteroidetes bacterium]